MRLLFLFCVALPVFAQPLMLPPDSKSAGAEVPDIPEDVMEKVDPSVVSIQHEKAGGTGFIISEDGYILSNGHVVRGSDPEQPMQPAKRITVILHDERKVAARVLGFSMDPDVALLKIEMDDPLVPVEMADSQNVMVGQRCFAVGTPVGLKRTFTSGILSNIRRTDLDTETVVFQTDAAINSGNSGGPLFDRQGRVLGINTYASRGQNNLGFTIPIHVAKEMIDDFKTHGRFIRSLIPLYFTSEIYDELRRTLDVESGILVSYVMNGSAAEQMGLQTGDILINLDGEPVSASSKAQLLDFEWEVTIRPAGEEMTLTVLRGKPGEREQVTLTGTLEELPPFPAFGRHLGQLTEHRYQTLGLGVEKLTDLHLVIHQIPNEPRGVFIKTVADGSVASRADLEPGDVLLEVNGVPTPNLTEFRQALDSALAEAEQDIILHIQRDRLKQRTALAPDYRLKNQNILFITPADPEGEVDVILRELWAMGATVTMVTPQGEEIARDELDSPLKADAALDSIPEEEFDILLIADGEGAEAFHENELILALVKDALENEKQLLACIGTSALLPLLATSEPLEEKITLPRELSGQAVSRGANYTGNAVESEKMLVTTTGIDRQVLRNFLQKMARMR